MQLPFNHNSLYDVPDVTPDIKKSSSKITIHDNHIIYIENYKCIKSITDTNIEIVCKKYKIIINGTGLNIKYYNNQSMAIGGYICEISFLQN